MLCNADNLPAVVVCNYGKDRTGLVAALIKSMLGESRLNIIEDFVMSEVYALLALVKPKCLLNHIKPLSAV